MKKGNMIRVALLLVLVGCKSPEGGPLKTQENPDKPKSQTPEPLETPVDLATYHELLLQPDHPKNQKDETGQIFHARYTLTAPTAGTLLIRVREPLVAKDPPLDPMPMLPSELRPVNTEPWTYTAGSHKSDGVAQRVLKLSKEELAAPLVIEVRMIHQRTPAEMVRVHLGLNRDNTKDPWLDFYQCKPATRTSRAGWEKQDDITAIDSTDTIILADYKFGGDDISELKIPLTRDGLQHVVVELGWKSDMHILNP